MYKLYKQRCEITGDNNKRTRLADAQIDRGEGKGSPILG